MIFDIPSKIKNIVQKVYLSWDQNVGQNKAQYKNSKNPSFLYVQLKRDLKKTKDKPFYKYLETYVTLFSSIFYGLLLIGP